MIKTEYFGTKSNFENYGHGSCSSKKLVLSCDNIEAGAKAAGFASQLGSFQTYFNLASMDKIFTPRYSEPASAASLRTAAKSQRYAASS